MELKNKVAVITGGASGLGEASVRRFCDLGAMVSIFDLNESRGCALVEELGDRVIYCNVNVCDEAAVKAGIDSTLKAFNAIHLCLNYAGVADAAKTVSRKGAFPLEIFQKVININLIGTFNVLRLVAEVMSKQPPVTVDGTRGVIINTASIAAFEGQIGQAAYSASKGGIVSLTLPVARDLAAYGIRVNTIAPGLIHTPMIDSMPEEAISALSSDVPFPPRLGTPDEIAKLAQSIVENEYLNGEVIRCDGAIRMSS